MQGKEGLPIHEEYYLPEDIQELSENKPNQLRSVDPSSPFHMVLDEEYSIASLSEKDNPQNNDSQRTDILNQYITPDLVALLSHTALHLTRHEQAAEDLVQDALVKACRFIDGFTPGTNFNAWILKILIHTNIDNMRKSKQIISLDLVKPESSLEKALVHPSAEEEALRDHFSEIEKALSEISPKFKNVLILRTLHNLSYQEIANKLDVPMGTVMSRINRAKKALKTLLNSKIT